MRPVSDLQRRVAPFQVISDYQPAGDQPEAIEELVRRINVGEQDVVLLGATGTGKSATTAWMIERLQRPTLVLVHNKTLAAQLANEFRELLPNNAVEYFVSYYDYYQPEAYVPQTDTFIEKDSSVNAEVERLRHSATNSLLTRRDVIVVATVSCIYGLGTPQEYVDRMVRLRVGEEIERNTLLRRFVDIQYKRNDLAFERGTFRVRGDTIEIIPMYEELAIRIEMFGDEIERLCGGAGENDFLARSCIEKSAHGFTCSLESIGCCIGEIMQAAMHIGIFMLIGITHAIEHLARLLCRGRIVEISQLLPIDGAPQNGKVLAQTCDVKGGRDDLFVHGRPPFNWTNATSKVRHNTS